MFGFIIWFPGFSHHMTQYEPEVSSSKAGKAKVKDPPAYML